MIANLYHNPAICAGIPEGYILSLIHISRESGELQQLLEYESYHDRLTGLFNRNRYVCDLKERFLDVQCAGILFLDLNNLKEVNDKYFHSEGDKLLCRLADTIYTATGEAGRCYRVGGDEFIIILPLSLIHI